MIKDSKECKKSFAMDCNFSLRRFSRGIQANEPHHKGLYFLDQQDVDDFVESYDDRSSDVDKASCLSHYFVLFVLVKRLFI